MERYRSGHNGADSKECRPLVSSCQRKQGIARLFRTIRSHFIKICLPVFLHFSGAGKTPVFTAYRRLNIKLIKYLWSGIEVVITALTRNPSAYCAFCISDFLVFPWLFVGSNVKFFVVLSASSLQNFFELWRAFWRKIIWSGIEGVITRTTRNRLADKTARGFESHPLRQRKIQ